MKIGVGSTNKVKVGAVEEILQEYTKFKEAVVSSVNAASLVSDQPLSLQETLRGAMNRAQQAFSDCDYGVGIESGLMAVPETKSGFMDVCTCVIFDGHEYYFGLSSAWEVPEDVMNYIKQGDDMDQAALKAGLTANARIGGFEGLVGVVTEGKLVRKDYTKQAIRMALIKLQ